MADVPARGWPTQPHEPLPKTAQEWMEGLSRTTRGFLVELLLYKSTFMAPWFLQLGEDRELRPHREMFELLAYETIEQAELVAKELREGDQVPGAPDRLDAATRVLRGHLFEDLLEMKIASTEIFLAAAMQAPNDKLRKRMIRLADMDRHHADRLRETLGTRPVRGLLSERSQGDAREPLGAHEGRRAEGSLAKAVNDAIHRLESGGAKPLRLTIGPVGLRHLRDEGELNEAVGTAFGLSVVVDLSWTQECFALETTDRVSVAELITERPDYSSRMA